MVKEESKENFELFCERFPTIYMNMFYENQFLNACCKFISEMKKQHPEWFNPNNKETTNILCGHKGRYISNRIWRCSECNKIVADWEKPLHKRLGV